MLLSDLPLCSCSAKARSTLANTMLPCWEFHARRSWPQCPVLVYKPNAPSWPQPSSRSPAPSLPAIRSSLSTMLLHVTSSPSLPHVPDGPPCYSLVSVNTSSAPEPGKNFFFSSTWLKQRETEKKSFVFTLKMIQIFILRASDRVVLVHFRVTFL